MATLQNIGVLKYRDKDGQWHPLPVVVQDASGGVSTISGKGMPTSATQGNVNQLYRDEDTQKLYICTSTDGGYTWAAVSGGSVDVDATLTKAGYAADAKAAGDAIQNATDKDAVRFVAQELTDTQKQQARENISAIGFTTLCDDSIEGWHDSADTKYKQALGLDTARGDFPIYITRVGYSSSFSPYMGYTLDGKYVMFYRYSDGSLSTTSPTYKNVVFIELTNSDGQWLSTTPFNIIQDYYNIKAIIYGVAEGCLLPLIYLDDEGCVFLGHTPNYSTVRVMVNNKSEISTSALFDKLSVVIASTTINGVTSYTVDKNFSEVLSACKDGATVVINYNNIIIPMVDFSDSQISFMISLYGFATINVFLREGDNDVCNVMLNRSPYYEFSAVYVNFMDGESEGLLDADYTYNELCDEIDYARNIYGYYQDRELTLTKYPYPEDGDLAYYSFTGVNQIDDKVYFERIDYKKDGTITYQKKEIGTDIDVMTGSSFDSDGTSGLVPTPPKWTSGDGDNLFLNCKGLWKPVIYKESWVNIASLCMTNDFPKIAIVIKGTSSVSGMVPNEDSGLMFYVRENGPSLIFFMIGESGKSYYVSYDRQFQSYGTVEGKYSLPSPATAQVGQIVKVKSVDESGKITETETVDMPTIPNDYELVFQETVAEDVGAYSRDTDKDGNPFSLTDVMVIIFTKPFAESTNSAHRGLGFLPTSKWGHDLVSCDIGDSISSANTNSVGRYNVAFAKVVNGYQVVTRAYESQNTTNVFGVLMRQTKANNEMFKFHSDATKLMQLETPQGNITCVKIVGYTNPLVSSGTIVALYKKKGT